MGAVKAARAGGHNLQDFLANGSVPVYTSSSLPVGTGLAAKRDAVGTGVDAGQRSEELRSRGNRPGR